jgi:hypothetical protein
MDKPLTLEEQIKGYPGSDSKCPRLGQPGFNFEEASAEGRRIAATVPYGHFYFNPATCCLVMHGTPFTEEDVYACY